MLYLYITLTSIFYLGASVFLSVYLRRVNRWTLRYAQFLAGTGILFHAWILSSSIWNNDSTFQAASLISNLSVTGLAALVALILVLRKRALIIAVIIFPLVALSMVILSLLSRQYATDSILPSAWLWAHIGLMVLGELMFFIAATTAAAYILMYRLLRKKHDLQVLTTVSSLPALDRVLGVLLSVGLFMLSVGLVLGGIFAQQFWEGDWWKDAKVIFAGLIWAAYTILVVWRLASPGFRGYRSALAAVIGFIFILFISSALSFVFPTQHLGNFNPQNQTSDEK